MLHRIRFSTFLFIVCFFLLPAWAIASQITSAATRENERVSFEGQTTLGEALTRLLNLTGEQVFFCGPVELTSVIAIYHGHPNDVLYDLLKKYSYVSTKMTDQNSPRIVVYTSRRTVPEDLTTVSSDEGRAFAQSESQNALRSYSSREVETIEAPAGRTGKLTSLSYARSGIIQGVTVTGSSSIVDADVEESDSTEEEVISEAYEPERDGNYVSETDDGDNFIDFSVDSPDRKQQLEVKIKQLEDYIVSGRAKETYLYWTEIKDPKYVYDPWEELEILQKRYNKL